MDEIIPNGLVELVRNAQGIVALSGAGVSAESGIPTFRDAQEGLWARFDPAQLATPEAFERDPVTVTRWYDWRRAKCAAARPNPAHRALARLEQQLISRGRRFTLITQNVDRLHQDAGSLNVIEIHGTLWVWRCTLCGKEQEDRTVPFPEFPPRCACGGYKRPAVVWFGEQLPAEAMDKASRAARECDLFISAGTSAVVFPAAGLAYEARGRGARIAEINAETTPLSNLADWSIQALCGVFLPALVDRAFS